MAITRTLTAIPVSEEERTWRANIETPRGGDYSIQVFRETVQKDAAGNVVAAVQSSAPVQRRASAIAGESVTLADGTLVPASLILSALPLFFDRWAEEDGR